MTREVESVVALPPSRDILIDSGDYSTAESIIYEPVYEKTIELPFTGGEVASWAVGAPFQAHDNYDPDVVWFAAFRASATTTGVYQLDMAGHLQWVYVDTVEKWCFIWSPKSGDFIKSGDWSLASGTIDITKIVFMPCLPVVLGAGFENLDTDSDEDSSVIGKISYVPIPEFIDVGSCKLYDRLATRRIYGETGLDERDGCSFWNEKIRVIVKLDVAAAENYIQIRQMSFVGSGLAWREIGNISLEDMISDPYRLTLHILENKPEIIRVLILSENPTYKDSSFEIILRRGENHVEIIHKDPILNPNLELSNATEFAWNDEATDALRAGVVAGGLYTTDRSEEFTLKNTTPVFSNHYGFLWKMGTYSYGYFTSTDIRNNMTADSFVASRLIEDLSNALKSDITTISDDISVYFGATWFSDWLRREAESADLLSGSVAGESDANAYGAFRLKFTGVSAYAQFELAKQKWESKFPDGEYVIAIRTWYEGAVNASLQIEIDDITAPVGLYNQTKTITTEGFYGEEWIVIEDSLFNFYADTHYRITLTRTDSNAGDLFVDAIVLIPKDRHNGIGAMRFPEGSKGLATATLKEAKQHPEYDKRR